MIKKLHDSGKFYYIKFGYDEIKKEMLTENNHLLLLLKNIKNVPVKIKTYEEYTRKIKMLQYYFNSLSTKNAVIFLNKLEKDEKIKLDVDIEKYKRIYQFNRGKFNKDFILTDNAYQYIKCMLMTQNE